MNYKIDKKYDDMIYMNIAVERSKLSSCKKKKVGAVIVKDNQIISYGYNRTPNGFDDICEDHNGNTKWYVLHAEANAILKMSYSSSSCKGASIYITHFPCKECCKLIYLSNIKRVIYLHTKNNEEFYFLMKLKIEIDKL
ncbi:deaminase [Blattabacterium sp. (Blaberus giganteus)]|uniref:deoxycytidylate deaminase n=1 Tax=Blattabacterium sp. (Blaberus giganteus) TaxID=1186051 RepID=UPI00025F6E79|nr:deaminase [Blattabacterium sp. (Blaberus giganteus)]AFJ90583.1 dCMP deaminase [Blattabacterium sp. (Blaberus giganteus)]